MFATDAFAPEDYGMYDARVQRRQTYIADQITPTSVQAYGTKFTVPDLPPSHESSHLLRVSKLESTLTEYQYLESDWDGYGGQPANHQSLEDAFSFINKLPRQAAIPRAMLSGSGEVSLYWEKGKSYAEASFPGDGTYHFILDSEKVVLTLDDLNPAEQKLDHRVLESIGSIYC